MKAVLITLSSIVAVGVVYVLYKHMQAQKQAEAMQPTAVLPAAAAAAVAAPLTQTAAPQPVLNNSGLTAADIASLSGIVAQQPAAISASNAPATLGGMSDALIAGRITSGDMMAIQNANVGNLVANVAPLSVTVPVNARGGMVGGVSYF